MPDFIYLASQSPRRRELLDQMGVAYRLLLPEQGEHAEDFADFDDAEALEAVRANEAPASYVRRVTRLKLGAALQRLQRRQWPLAPVLCADTTVALGREIYGKPADAADAERMLAALSGTSHRVLTAVAVHTEGTGRLEALSASSVRFAALSAQQIDSYVHSGEPFGKAGAYAVQGKGALFIAQLSGSYSGIMGLPVAETAALLAAAGVNIWP